jgi:hypothetical protein
MTADAGASPATTFEFGLSLAGGVSCGAFSAGAIDFIVEALDIWEAARERGDADAPPHHVSLRMVAGASSGALTSAVLAAALPYELSHVRRDSPAAVHKANPLFASWVDGTSLSDLLGSADASGDGVRSLLDPTRVEQVARAAIDFGSQAAARQRGWLADPLRLAFSVTNLRGVNFSLTNGRSSVRKIISAMHGDFMRFAFSGLGGTPAAPPRPDETAVAVQRHAPDGWERWGRRFATAALGSAAFPLFLPARRQAPPAGQYSQASIVLPGGSCEPDEVLHPRPIGPAAQPHFEFDAADGGLIDNNALDVVRTELAGGDPLACNERDGRLARRAVLLIDPLLGAPGVDSEALRPISLGGTLAALVRTLLDQARLRPQDVALALRGDVYSRFIIAPQREVDGEARQAGGECASKYLAGASLGGLGGYLAREFRLHDYLLGRRNAQQALAERFVLHADNPLFRHWSAEQRQRFAVGEGQQQELPIIPLTGQLHPRHGKAEPLPEWPLGKADPAAYAPALDARLGVLYSKLLKPWYLRLLLWPLWLLLRRPLRQRLVKAMASGLRTHGLA